MLIEHETKNTFPSRYIGSFFVGEMYTWYLYDLATSKQGRVVEIWIKTRTHVE